MRVHVLILGCARTLVDSEGLSGILEKAGHSITESLPEADCVVINTCAFIREAEEESVRTILDVADLKKTGKLRRLYVAGCLPQKRRGERADLLKLLPEVDGFLGPGDLPKLPELIREQLETAGDAVIERQTAAGPAAVRPARGPLRPVWILPRRGAAPRHPRPRFFVTSPVPTLLFDSDIPRHRLTPSHFAYLKISEGCDHACTFCSIPQFRGAHRSRTIEDLVRDAELRAAEGAVELNLVGQDTSYYGTDLYGSPRLPELLEKLSTVEGIRWIRLLYAHPAHVTEELIRAIRDFPPIVKYIDIPLQHINDSLLVAMRRETDGVFIRRLIERFRREIPGVALRTTFIVGFPGETEEQVDELADFVREARFERVGIFPYSPEPKTPSERMPNQIPEEVKQERLNRLMQLQQGIAEGINQTWLGREMEILIDEPDQDPNIFLGRTYADAPEVDGQVFVKSARPLKPGQFVRAKVTDTYEYDLVAEAIASGS
ncbi:MAG: 30S ribosomal protein S12 methylthiotransferase RimO [Candidatus Omnitrophica bacterium]|nr:30S ribosomal protein S12 methylthiotransferase RimO [Candidatus Omnitrophota bacterium]